MTPKEISHFRSKLLAWFEAHHRKLPWRETKNPYRIWVSEVMLQQTQVKKVLEYYEKFLTHFPTIRHLAEADLQDVLKVWEGLGYYARARNLYKAAKVVVQEMNAQIPADYQTFRRLPGVGAYIGAAVQSIAFGHPYAVVDGNLKRVLARLFLVEAPINQSATAKILQEHADLLLEHNTPGHFNQAMMELGATICRPTSPLCLTCPVNTLCGAFQTARQTDFPVRIKRRPTPERHDVIGVVHKDGRVLITQRPHDGLLGGLWEFPSGEIIESEAAETACIRVIGKSVRLNVEVVRFLERVTHAYTHFKVVADVFHCRYLDGAVSLDGPIDYRWIRIDEIDQFPFPRVNHKFIPLLRGE